MMGDIRARAAERIVLLQITQGPAEPPPHPLNRMAIESLAVGGAELEQVAQAPLLHGQGPVHVGLAQIQIGVHDQFAIERPVVEPHRDRGRATRPETLPPPGRRYHRELSDPNDAAEKCRQHHGSLLASCSEMS
ncbi:MULTISPECIES: hypothetical protein [Halomonadaceae]|uniref:hypothetical protein n=1 Tax=Halomonas sp. M20 TaxID=2763264 RepID=UPI001D0B9F1B|nr:MULTISPECIES: hypothetical protein [Halomonas]